MTLIIRHNIFIRQPYQ